MCSTGAPQGTVLAPFLFNIYTSDIRYNSGTCHLQKFSDDTAIVGCIRNGQEAEYRKLVSDFVSWYKLNQLQLNITPGAPKRRPKESWLRGEARLGNRLGETRLGNELGEGTRDGTRERTGDGTNGWTGEQAGGWTGERTGGGTNGWTIDWTGDWTKDWTNDGKTGGWTNGDWTGDWTNGDWTGD
ncbi:hypothetical protein NFI96_027613 [Prochilodus magdalenae]|nr:hypothetical protein NFI96_027613 [Prochilodus magdalenae]